MVATAFLGMSATADAAPVGAPVGAMEIDCTNHYNPHQNLSSVRKYVKDGQPARSGPLVDCTVRFRGPVEVDLHCWKFNGLGNVWWFVQGARGQGWVFEENFGSVPATGPGTMCPV